MIEADKEFVERIKRDLDDLKKRVEDMEAKRKEAYPINTLTPNSDLDDTKKVLNYLINYLNIGVKNQPGVK